MIHMETASKNPGTAKETAEAVSMGMKTVLNHLVLVPESEAKEADLREDQQAGNSASSSTRKASFSVSIL